MAERTLVRAPEKVDIQMTPMIDVVFQLMAFFLMTFKVVNVEGDFNLKVPRAEMRSGDLGSPDNIRVSLIGREGAPAELAGILVGESHFSPTGPDDDAPFDDLRGVLKTQINRAVDAGLPEPEITIEVGADLRYQYVLKTIESVSTKIDDAGKPTQLAKKIKLVRR